MYIHATKKLQSYKCIYYFIEDRDYTKLKAGKTYMSTYESY